MAKLTPPAPQHLKKREDFFKAHPELPKAKGELEKIARIKEYKGIGPDWKALPRKKRGQQIDGAEYYRKFKEQYKDAPGTVKVRQENVVQKTFKNVMKLFNRGK